MVTFQIWGNISLFDIFIFKALPFKRSRVIFKENQTIEAMEGFYQALKMFSILGKKLKLLSPNYKYSDYRITKISLKALQSSVCKTTLHSLEFKTIFAG